MSFDLSMGGCLSLLYCSKLPDPNDPPASASCVAGNTGKRHHSQLEDAHLEKYPVTWAVRSSARERKREGVQSPRVRPRQVRASAEPLSQARAGAQHNRRTWRRSQARDPPTPAPAEAPSPPLPLRRTRAQVREAAPAGDPADAGPPWSTSARPRLVARAEEAE